MNFEPVNRHILVKFLEQTQIQEEPLIVLPDEYKKPESPYAVCTVFDVATDSKFFNSFKKHDTIVIERRMLQKIEVEANEFYLVLDNYILGRIEDEINQENN